MAVIIKAAIFIVLVLASIDSINSRAIIDEHSVSLETRNNRTEIMLEKGGVIRTTSVTCEPDYFFLPCTSNVWGELFLIFVYEYLLSLSSQYISQGSELFLETSGTENIFSANIFQMLGMFPQIIVLLVSGFSGTADTVGTMAEMGMGMLAGSVIMNLTIIWGSVVAFGSYDISESSTNSQTKKKFSLTGYGVKTDVQTKHTAVIMLLSMIPFLLLQLAVVLTSSSAKKVVIVVCLVISVLFLVAYLTYQALTPWIKERRLEYVMKKYVQSNLLQPLRLRNGEPNQAAITELFNMVDQNKSKEITAAELRALFVGLQVQEFGLDADGFVSKLFLELDKSTDSSISEDEFHRGVSKLLTESNVTSQTNKSPQPKKKASVSTTNSQGSSEEQQSLLNKSSTSKASSSGKSALWSYIKAAVLIVFGTAVTFVLATPLMTSIQDFATDINIPSFLISYVVVPFALGFKMAFSSISSAMHKTETAVSLTLSELYGGVFMNNVMGMMIFLALVCIKDITWDVSAEVLTVLIICSFVGLSNIFSTEFPVWTSVIAYALYPLSLAFIYVLTTLLGWG